MMLLGVVVPPLRFERRTTP